MKPLFKDVNFLDKRCYEEFLLNEDILMENAASGLESEIKKIFFNGAKLFILAGPGNNGADGVTLARKLAKEFEVRLYLPYGAKSPMCKLQLERAKKVGVSIVDEVEDATIFVDALFGSGLSTGLDTLGQKIIEDINLRDGYKIACDFPSGIDKEGNIQTNCFEADVTVTMGAGKIGLYSDVSKNFTGEIKVVNLGVSEEVYLSKETDSYLLEKKDLELPLRKKLSSHKGDFGHLVIVSGDKEGASIIAGESGLTFGAGLVTLLTKERFKIPYHLMQTTKLPQKTSSIAIGMGLGNVYKDEEIIDIIMGNYPVVVDADLFHKEIIKDILEKKSNLVLTPHAREFASLMNILELENGLTAEKVQKSRFSLALRFSKFYPETVLVLKGANSIIAYQEKLYINQYGTPALSKGGSGDILTGLIGSLLAQGYSTLDASISANLAHSLASKKSMKNNYALLPEDIIKNIAYL